MATTFSTLVDSPMFRKQLYTLEQTNDELKDRCQRLHKGCKRFTATVGEAYDGDMSFAQSLEAFGAAQEDPVSVSIGGPLMSEFITAFKELGSYKEVLRSEVEQMLSNRLAQLINVDMQNVKDCRRRFDKASAGYDQAREKFMSLKKGTRGDIVAELEENLHSNKSAFERCRFNLVHALANIESKKKFEFLDIISAVMDAHMQYFKKGYELFSQMEPLFQQVLAYIQKSKELVSVEKDKLEKRMQELIAQSEHANVRSSNNMDATSRDGLRVMGFNSYKNIEALMQSTANGKVKIIKQGYLLKRSSNLRGDWKRRFFVLDSHGTLYYYRDKWSKQQIFPFTPISSCHTDGNRDYRTVDLRTSTIKKDAEQTDLRFCFRIISPVKTFTLQAENEADRMDWGEKITGVITSLLNSTLPQHFSTDSQSFSDAHGADAQLLEGNMSSTACYNVSKILGNVPGNDACAECGASDPDWASLNLGIIMCIECSGVHRNLGVHISKVRSLTLDVKVWEPPVVDLFCALGNAYSNSVWEELLLFEDERTDESNFNLQSIKKPNSNDAISRKEKYIHAKYVDKSLIVREKNQSNLPLVAVRIWEAVKNNNVQTAYRLLVASDACPNTKYDEVNSELYHKEDMPPQRDISYTERNQLDPKLCGKIKDTCKADGCWDGCSLMHLACHVGDPVMLELLLQFGGDINSPDFHSRTPLHHCVSMKNNGLAKYLIRRGANASAKDGGGLTALERAMEQGQTTDDALVILLANRS